MWVMSKKQWKTIWHDINDDTKEISGKFYLWIITDKCNLQICWKCTNFSLSERKVMKGKRYIYNACYVVDLQDMFYNFLSAFFFPFYSLLPAHSISSLLCISFCFPLFTLYYTFMPLNPDPTMFDERFFPQFNSSQYQKSSRN